jgi:hypothetical protein
MVSRIWDPDLGPGFGTRIWERDLGPGFETTCIRQIPILLRLNIPGSATLDS